MKKKIGEDEEGRRWRRRYETLKKKTRGVGYG